MCRKLTDLGDSSLFVEEASCSTMGKRQRQMPRTLSLSVLPVDFPNLLGREGATASRRATPDSADSAHPSSRMTPPLPSELRRADGDIQQVSHVILPMDQRQCQKSAPGESSLESGLREGILRPAVSGSNSAQVRRNGPMKACHMALPSFAPPTPKHPADKCNSKQFFGVSQSPSYLSRDLSHTPVGTQHHTSGAHSMVPHFSPYSTAVFSPYPIATVFVPWPAASAVAQPASQSTVAQENQSEQCNKQISDTWQSRDDHDCQADVGSSSACMTSSWQYGALFGTDSWVPPSITSPSERDSEEDYLSACNSCGRSLQGFDIFMYRGETAFCSDECRQREMPQESPQRRPVARTYSMVPDVPPNSKPSQWGAFGEATVVA
eukprot:TRINITY_DN24715_c0_g1_i1.p1 TRINITY_DN24715_c0_g1~~TRINITY_DN24715_c0_g1_i1.p1  ORF type:complete len:379 (-),score=29.98 TRINITY_DN24715_c0_g1_i1:94-1230(-)